MVSNERIKVTLTGGAPWGFRLSGGGSLPLTINKIRKKSQAHQQGLKEGDAVLTINSTPVYDKTQDGALELVDRAGDTLELEIFRGDVDELSRERPKRAIVPGGRNESSLIKTETESSFIPRLNASASIDNVTSDSFETAESDAGSGLKLTAVVSDISGNNYGNVQETTTTSNFTITATVDDISSSANMADSISAEFRAPVSFSKSSHFEEMQTSTTLQPISAEPFVDSYIRAPELESKSLFQSYSNKTPPAISPKPKTPVQNLSPRPFQVINSNTPVASPGVFKPVSPQPRQVSPYSPVLNPQMQSLNPSSPARSPRPTSISPRPPAVSPKPLQPYNPAPNPPSQNFTMGAFKNTNSAVTQKTATPFSSSFSNYKVTTTAQQSRSDDTFTRPVNPHAPPVSFKPSKFVPSSGPKEIPGLYTPGSPQVDVSVHAMYKEGKENVSPTRMFQVKNIVSNSNREVWRPNIRHPVQQHPVRSAPPPADVMTPKEDFSPYPSFPVPKVPQSHSLVERQKQKLMEPQYVTQDYEFYEDDDADSYYTYEHTTKAGKAHVFAPPVEIHAAGEEEFDFDTPYYRLYGVPQTEDEFLSAEEEKKRKMYADSAFYDTPGKKYPTIEEQMKLCKEISKSLTSTANRRARGAKMFMKRKRKSNKWVHEGQSEWSSSAGDVANIYELESELDFDEGGSKPLFAFKIPNLKHRPSDGNEKKMALTQEQFEKLRLNAKKCDHKNIAPDAAFDLAADLKSSKGRAGRLFERRKQRSDKFVIDENNARFPLPQKKLENVLAEPVRPNKTPWQAAAEHDGNMDAAFQHISDFERNQRLNTMLKCSPPRKLQTTPMPNEPRPVHTSLKADSSSSLLRGKNFNRSAKGWCGGGEYPISESVQHVPTPAFNNIQTQPQHQQQQYGNYNNKVKAWQSSGQSPYVSLEPETPVNRQDQWKEDWQTRSIEEWPENQNSYRQETSTRQSKRKSWHPDTRPGQSYENYSRTSMDYKRDDYPSVAYMQPIIPGTDL